MFADSSTQSKVLILALTVAFVMLCIGMFTHHLAESKFTIPRVPGIYPQTIYGRSNVGLFLMCVTLFVKTTEGLKIWSSACMTLYDRDSILAAVILAVVAAVIALVGLILALFNITNDRFKDKASTKLAIGVCAVISDLLIFAMFIDAYSDRDITLRFYIDVPTKYNFGWTVVAFLVAAFIYSIIPVYMVVEEYVSRRNYRILCSGESDETESAPLTKEQCAKAGATNGI